MNTIALMSFLSRELLRLTEVKHCVSIRTYDAEREQHIFRWFGGGKTVGLRMPVETDQKAAEQYAQEAFREWSAIEAGNDDAAEYDRLRHQAEAAGMGWMEFWMDD